MTESFYGQIKDLTILYHQKVQSSTDRIFIGLRDFYGMIISFATLKPETWYFSFTRNFSGSLTPVQYYKIVMWRRIEPTSV